MLDIIKAVIYGVIEGITEWLPISSTGHMILAEQVLRFEALSEPFMGMFRVVIQLGAILAVVVIFWNKLWPFRAVPARPIHEKQIPNPVARWLAEHIRWPVMILWFKILFASIPVGIVGLLLDDWLDAHLYTYPVVGLMLIVYGVAFLVVEKKPRRVRQTKLSQLTFRDALVVGIFQILALIPGTSRSGATILGGILWGLGRPLAAQFTFFLAIPAMMGASLLKVVKFFIAGNPLTGVEVIVLLVGCLTAFLVSLACIRFLMQYVRDHDFRLFGLYRIVLGVIVLGVWAVTALVGAAPITPAA